MWGFFLQRLHVRYLCVASLSTCAASVFLMLVSAHIGSLPLMFFAFLCWGFGFGGTVPLGEFIWAKYFGRVHIGAVRGASVPYILAFQALDPIVGGLYYDAYGSYVGVFAAAKLIGAIAILASREPPPKTTSVSRPPLIDAPS